MKVIGKDDIPYIMENKKMFETINQIMDLFGISYLDVFKTSLDNRGDP